MLGTHWSQLFLNLFPVPEQMLLSNAGVVVRDRSVKFFQFRRGFFGRSAPPAYSNFPLVAGVMQAGEIQNTDALINVLKELALGYGVRYAHATLPEEKAYLFTTSIAKVPLSGLRDAVAFILEENVPLTLADAVFDYHVVKSDDPGMIKVAVSVLPKKIVISYIEAFKAAGIIPISFTIESQAIAEAIVPYGEMQTQLIVNLGEEKTGFYVVEDGVVQFSATPAQGTLHGEVAPDVHDLKKELTKVLAFWDTRVNNSEGKEKKIEKITLCGTGASKTELVDELMADLSLPHTLADVWANIPADHLRVRKELYAQSSEYAAVIGLSLPQIS